MSMLLPLPAEQKHPHYKMFTHLTSAIHPNTYFPYLMVLQKNKISDTITNPASILYNLTIWVSVLYSKLKTQLGGNKEPTRMLY